MVAEIDRNPWRSDFSVLNQTMHGKRLAFLDSGASAQKPDVVLDAVRSALADGYANIHRGLYEFSQGKTAAFEAVRRKVADFIGARDAQSIVFTRNSTEAINLVAQSWGRTFLKEGDEIILTEMEHHANFVPWHILKNQIGIVIKYIPVLDDGALDIGALSELLTNKTRLVAFTHVSNVLGTVNPVAEISKIVRKFSSDIKILIDGTQGVVHAPVDISAFDPDFFVFTGHKLYGPTGVGVLYGRKELLDSIPPWQGGGDMIERVTLDGVAFAPVPAKFEAGTPAIAEVIGLGAAIDYLNAIGMDKIAAWEQKVLHYATEKVSAIEGVCVYGTTAGKAGIISFNIDGCPDADIAMILDRCGVAVRTGHHCCQPLMQRFGVEGTVRASIGLYTNKDDIDQLVAGLLKARDMLL
ncbi:MAG TPA: SufS family cysteine desulfurase [Alphaproteobacteria bacterium]|nr:SufS family cysteine desulfurase [Alphaproteobacteria bacterium]HNS44836.1 SufS family cysteine desulfurase [Alphaproteobacteria bacterium]